MGGWGGGEFGAKTSHDSRTEEKGRALGAEASAVGFLHTCREIGVYDRTRRGGCWETPRVARQAAEGSPL